MSVQLAGVWRTWTLRYIGRLSPAPDQPPRDFCAPSRGTAAALRELVGSVQPRPAGVDLQPDDRVGIYRIVRRIAPQYYDAEDALTHRRITIETGTRDDSRLDDDHNDQTQTKHEPLSHPGLAQILDHGALYDERPWVASQR